MPPLERIIRELIESEGPMRLDRYMSLCLGHPEHGYYMAQEPFGEDGDFITAPEVSQVFGELTGVWAVAAWAAMGQPNSFALVELGPGRGTLMADMLRTLRKAAPPMAAALSVHLVETSPRLREIQRHTLGDGVSWHDRLDSVPDQPMILVANEFFDALPIRQFEKRLGQWHERVVGIEDGSLALGLVPAELGPQGRDGDVIEFAPVRHDVGRAIGERLGRNPGAALVIDYGHLATAPGDTLQAMRSHAHVPVTEQPGRCDLTSHVDFEGLAKAIAAGGGLVHPPLTQRAFLLAMGLDERTRQLAAKSDAATSSRLIRQAERLAAEDQMGKLFKVLAATSPELGTPYPFGRT
jgi:NADH dehydrogenase [ubiquinone] 1 alpha subcomplex assembly factor 7